MNQMSEMAASRKGPGASSRSRAVGVLDIGGSKTTCFIARLEDAERNHIRVAGVGHQRSRGLVGNTIVDLDETVAAVQQVIHKAETMAGISVSSLSVNLATPGMMAHRARGFVRVGGREVSERDVKRAKRTALAAFDMEERTVVHAIAQRYYVDDNADVRDPRGMYAHQMGVEMCLVSAPMGPIRNIALALDRCRIGLKSVVATPYACGLSALVDDERNLGATVIDMGAATTSFAVFNEGVLEHMGVIPIGGEHVTKDIARGLQTPVASAERIKTMYGSVLEGPDDDREMIDCPGMCDDPRILPEQAPRTLLTGIVRPRVEETLEKVRDQLDARFTGPELGTSIVLVGGASQLSGMAELASQVFGRSVRLGHPLGLSGLAESVSGAGFAAAAGSLRHSLQAQREAINGAPELDASAGHGFLSPANPVHRLWSWISEHL